MYDANKVCMFRKIDAGSSVAADAATATDADDDEDEDDGDGDLPTSFATIFGWPEFVTKLIFGVLKQGRQ